LLVITFVFSAVGQLFGPAEAAVIPTILPRSALITANSMALLTMVLTLVVGGALAPRVGELGARHGWLRQDPRPRRDRPCGARCIGIPLGREPCVGSRSSGRRSSIRRCSSIRELLDRHGLRYDPAYLESHWEAMSKYVKYDKI